MECEIDFSQKDGKKPRGPYLEDGVYNVKVATSELRNSKRSGKPMLVISFVVEGGEYKKKKFTVYFMLHTALWKLRQLNLSAGLETNGMVKIDPDSYLDKEMRVEIYISRDQSHRVICKEIEPLEKAPF